LNIQRSLLRGVLGIDPGQIEPYETGPSGPVFYHSFEVRPKRRGKTSRRIDCPVAGLKDVQRALLEKILSDVPPHAAATAYFPGRSVAENARKHHGCRYLYKTDISNFFGSITVDAVWRVLRLHFPYLSHGAMAELVDLTTFKGALPQGAPTSPHIANLALYEFDESISLLCRRLGATYTRYADDIAISGDDDEAMGIAAVAVRSGLAELGLAQHPSKTRLFGEIDRKVVTGLDVSGDTIRPTRAFRKKAASLVRMCEVYPNRMEKHLRRVRGYLSYWYGTTPDDPDLRTLQVRIERMSGRQPSASI
jgi:hypothetical protein